ncbi:MAG: dienelactone hydrolase family protein [Pseudomonadota bacterium]
MAGSFIDIPTEGGSFKAYIALPASGSGPGMMMLQEIFGISSYMKTMADLYAEEGYVAVVPDLFWRLEPGVSLDYTEAGFKRALELNGRFDSKTAIVDMTATVKALRAHSAVQGKVGALGFCLGGRLAVLAAAHSGIDAGVSYYGVGIEKELDSVKAVKCPMVLHFAEKDSYTPTAVIDQVRAGFKGKDDVEIYVYPGADHGFNSPMRKDRYDRPASMMAHTRSLALLRRVLGPRHDLSALWEAHTMYEFGTRDVDACMKTMVAQPYVNHVPTMTGGVGHDQLKRFYANHFIPKTPKDTRLVPISRTIGADRIVDEMLFCFTHDIEIDWMLPGVKPTGKYVEIPLVAIVNFRGDKLYHEHIYWDQASVLVQIGLLDPKNLPVAGVETAKKIVDEKQPSNRLMARWAESEGR